MHRISIRMTAEPKMATAETLKRAIVKYHEERFSYFKETAQERMDAIFKEERDWGYRSHRPSGWIKKQEFPKIYEALSKTHKVGGTDIYPVPIMKSMGGMNGKIRGKLGGSPGLTAVPLNKIPMSKPVGATYFLKKLGITSSKAILEKEVGAVGFLGEMDFSHLIRCLEKDPISMDVKKPIEWSDDYEGEINYKEEWVREGLQYHLGIYFASDFYREKEMASRLKALKWVKVTKFDRDGWISSIKGLAVLANPDGSLSTGEVAKKLKEVHPVISAAYQLLVEDDFSFMETVFSKAPIIVAFTPNGGINILYSVTYATDSKKSL